jgi:hypothetical protein
MRGCPIGQAARRSLQPCRHIIGPDMSTIEANEEVQ